MKNKKVYTIPSSQFSEFALWMIKTAASLSYALYDWKTTLAYAFSLNKEDLIQFSNLQIKSAKV